MYMNEKPDREIEQIEQGLEAFLEQETYEMRGKQRLSGWPEETARGGQDGFDIKTDMLPETRQREREGSRLPAGAGYPSEEIAYSRTSRPPADSSRPQPGRFSEEIVHSQTPRRSADSSRAQSGRSSEEIARSQTSRRSADVSRPQPGRSSEEIARSQMPRRSAELSRPRTGRSSEEVTRSRTPRPPADSPRRQSARPSEETAHSRTPYPQSARPSAKSAQTPKRHRPDLYEPDYDERQRGGYKEDYEDDYDDDCDYECGYEEERDDDYEEECRPRVPRKRRKKKSFLKRLLVLLLILCVLVGGLWYYAVGRVYGMMRYEEVSSLASLPLKEDGVTNILLIGNDSRSQGEDGRSDAMILLSISERTKTIHMMSLLRDIYVEIPGREGNRLNAAYSFGGPELLLETLKQNFDLEVNRYVLVNFQAFAGVVDAVGGVDLDLTNEEVQYVNGYLTEYNNLEGRPEGTDYLDNMAVGTLHLNGPQALAYCRIRYIGTDFGRTERQREVLSAVMRKAPKALLTNPKGLLGGLLPNLTTNLTESECRQLSLLLFNLLGYDMVQSSIPIQGSYQNAKIRGMAVLEVDFEANKAYIRENIYGK